MKFVINRNLLETSLQNVSRGLSNKTPMPILMGILITAKNNKLTFITTNKEISIKVVLDSSDNLMIYEEGSCVVPGKYFVDIVKKVEGDTIDFTLFDETTIKIISNKSDFTLVSFDKNNFPITNFNFDVEPFSIKCKELKQIIKQTSFACSTSESRIVLTSLHFTLSSNSLIVCATDSFRLARKDSSIQNNKTRLQINVPCKSLDELAKIITDSNDDILIYIENNKALFKYKNIDFMTRLVEGNYPDVDNLIPRVSTAILKFDRNSLIAAVDRASLFMENQDINHVRFKLSLNKDEIEISSNSSEIGKVEETIVPLECVKKDEILIAFTAKYLLDALKAFETKTVTLLFCQEVKPLMIVSEEQPSLTQLLIPVRAFI